MNVAFVYDRVNKFGGAERVLLALHKIWPKAPLYTAVYDPNRAPWASVFDVRTSFLQRIPLARTHHELFPWLTPLAFESFSFDEFDVVISVTSAEAKGIITKPHTLHICYCLTPTRYLWSGYEDYIAHPGMGVSGHLIAPLLRRMAPRLRSWDLIAASRPDHYIAISKLVKARIETYYHREVDAVIYPPVGISQGLALKTKPQGEALGKQDYFLTVSRLVGYKRVDLLIDAFNDLGLPLKIIGSGGAKSELQAKAKGNIEFIDRYLTDAELNGYYQRCRAFIFAGNEDFGLVAAEAQATGTPVICYKQSGMAEIIIDGKTGIAFEQQSAQSIKAAVERFGQIRYNAETIRRHVTMFDEAKFAKLFHEFTEQQYSASMRGGQSTL